MISISGYDPNSKEITFIDDAFTPVMSSTFSLYEVFHWAHVARSKVTTRKDFIMAKIRRIGGTSWIQKQLRKIQYGGRGTDTFGYYQLD